ncbi:MAG: WecB/TagA/CpsF family glycosyltransferase [Planctomycetes bacterium]|nr:WecB/TagA/CpsF family glycosyltransferase [Planctomycetota bacterium]
MAIDGAPRAVADGRLAPTARYDSLRSALRSSPRVLGHPVWSGAYAVALAELLDAAQRRIGGSAYFCNVHMAVEAVRNRVLGKALARSEWVFPDGVPLVAALRLLGQRRAQRVAGMDAVPDLCRAAAARGLRVFFYGSDARTLSALRLRLSVIAPDLDIAGMISPPYRALSEAEEAAHLAEIEASGAHLCFVGLGCPKQELWIARNRARTGAVLLGVGAAFSTTAGNMTMAPAWMRDGGLEWAYRLAQEPGRLWRRYAQTNPLFVNRLLRQLWAR